MVLAIPARAEERILWYSIGDGLTNTTNLQSAIDFAVANNYNAICVLTRYRANAYYKTNRDYSTYANPETQSSGAAGDTLQFVIDRGHEAGLRVYAAFSCFIVSDGASSSYPPFLDANWKTWCYKGNNASNTVYSPAAGYPRPMVLGTDLSDGYWVDPGMSAVRNYTIRILKDLVQNYDVDGIMLDRVRYPGDEYPHYDGAFGYNPTALSEMSLTNPGPGSTTFRDARRAAITTFVKDAAAAVGAIKPWVIMGATPVVYGTTLVSTEDYVFQYFPGWNNAVNPGHTSGYGAIDLIAPQYYRSTASVNGDLMDLVNGKIDEVSRIFHMGTFGSAYSDEAEMAGNIRATRIGSRNMKGWGIFNYSSCDGTYNSTMRANAPDVLGSASPKTQFTLKTNWDSTPPNGVTNFVGIQSGTTMNLNWTAPSPAGDGDGATHYLLYRSTSPGVKEYYSNLVLKTPTLTGTTYIDMPGPGTFYYRVVPVDNYNNHGTASEIGPFNFLAETDLVPDLKISTGSGRTESKMFSWFATDSACRGIALNKATGHLLVATRTGGTAVRILDTTNFTELNSPGLNMTGVSGGTFPINKVVCTDNGIIYVCNLATTGFKIYQYANEAAAPVVCTINWPAGLEASVRKGDDVAIMGTGVDTKILVSGSGVDSVFTFVATNATANTFNATRITTGLSNSGQNVEWDSNGTHFFMKYNNNNFYRYNLSGSVTNTWSSVGPIGTQYATAVMNIPEAPASYYGSWCGTNAAGTDPPVYVRVLTPPSTVGDIKFRLLHTAAGERTLACSAAADTTAGGDVVYDRHHNTVYTLWPNNSICKFTDPAMVPVNVSSLEFE